MAQKSAQTTNSKGSTTKAPSPRSRPRPGALKTMEQVRLELSRVYRDARAGIIRPSDATKLGFLLQVLAKIIESMPKEGTGNSFDDLLKIVQAKRDLLDGYELQQAVSDEKDHTQED